MNDDSSNNEFHVTSFPDSDYSSSSVASLSDGGFVIISSPSFRPPDQRDEINSSSSGVIGQRYDANGNLVGDEFQIGNHDVFQWGASVAPLSNNSFVVVWMYDAISGVFGQHYDANGSVIGDEFRVGNFDLPQINSSVATLSDDGFVVTWTYLHALGRASSAFGQRFDADGNIVGGQFLDGELLDGMIINGEEIDNSLSIQLYGEFHIGNADGLDQNSSVAALSDGGYVVTGTASSEVFGQRFNANSELVGSTFQVNTTSDDLQSRSDVALLLSGGFVVVWSSSNWTVDGGYIQDQEGHGIYGQHFDVDGNRIGSEFLISSNTEAVLDYPSVASLSSGGFVVTWTSSLNDGSNTDIYGKKYDADGEVIGDEFQINSTTNGHQYRPDVASLSNDGFVVTWSSDELSPSTMDIVGKVFMSADYVSVSITIISWASSIALAEVGLQQNISTDINGQATLPVNTSTIITPFIPSNSSADGAVNLQDAILLLRQIVGLDTLNEHQAVSADFDQNGSADLNDAIGILKHIVGLPAAEPEWIFMESGASEPLTNGELEITADSGSVELVGVLTGDVDGSWAGVEND